jgi:hypothetical protein
MMTSLLRRLYIELTTLPALPLVLFALLRPAVGRDYGVGFADKLALVVKMMRNGLGIPAASTYLEHVVMATHILSVPRDVEGAVVECGCYKGGSTANLSLVAAAVGRRLMVFDSFEGLPEPTSADREHVLVDRNEAHTYTAGSYAGSLDEVQANIRRWGAIDVCSFHRGFFEQTLPGFDTPCVAVFADVDYRSSLETTVRHIWPRLEDGGTFFTHEATHMEIASLFFDREWWREQLGESPPGLVGAGNGIGLVPQGGSFRSPLGYAIKNRGWGTVREVPQSP